MTAYSSFLRTRFNSESWKDKVEQREQDHGIDQEDPERVNPEHRLDEPEDECNKDREHDARDDGTVRARRYNDS